MSSYTNYQAKHTFEAAGQWHKLIEPLHWDLGYKGSALTITVPTNFLFDVSVPFWLRWAIDPENPKYFKAAALHDFLLSKGWSRTESAAVFHEALKADQIHPLKRAVMFIVVALYKYS